MPSDTDILIVGGGPAGCAAAVMASSLGMRSVLIEPGELAHKLHNISSTVNVLGGFATGRDLAVRISDDVNKADACEVLRGERVTAVRTTGETVSVELTSGAVYRAPYAVVATGVRPQATTETDWITQDGEVGLKALWEADASELDGAELLVLGIDRPLGTMLRTHADLDMRLLVLYSTAEQYKADEIRTDKRVVLLPTSQLELFHDRDGVLHLRAVADTGEDRTFVGHHTYLNLGSRPVVLEGVRTNGSGYCPPELQHERILIAGDLRAARYQRIMTAFGSGAEAALKAYYALNDVPG